MMTLLNRRSFLRSAAAAASLPLLGQRASAQDPLKIAFLYFGPVGDFGYSYSHDRARQKLAEELGRQVATSFQENVAEADAEQVLGRFAQQGYQLIFATSLGYMKPAVRVAQQYPDVYFEHATGFQRARNLATYNARFYQGRAVTGAIAGQMSEAGIAGYVASFPVPEVIVGINAFTLAARRVNPEFKVKVVWTNSWFDPAQEAEAARVLIAQGVDVITHHTDSPAPLQLAEERGVIGFGQASDMLSFAPKSQMTAIIYNWAPYYISRAKAVLDGSWKTGDAWWGMKEGAIEMAPYHSSMPQNAINAAEAVRKGLADGSFDPFAGPIADQLGRPRIAAGGTISDSQLLSMDWFVEGVES